MDKKRIKQIERLLKRVTPGEWYWHHRVGQKGWDGMDSYKPEGSLPVLQWRTSAWIQVKVADAELIEQAVPIIRELLEEVKKHNE